MRFMDFLKRISQKQYIALLIAWTAIILLLLLLPSKAFASGGRLLTIPHADKAVHFVLFATETFLCIKNLEFVKEKIHYNIYLSAVTDIFFFGLLTEILQGLMYNTAKRTFSWADLAFDTLAAIAAALVMYFNKRKCQRK